MPKQRRGCVDSLFPVSAPQSGLNEYHIATRANDSRFSYALSDMGCAETAAFHLNHGQPAPSLQERDAGDRDVHQCEKKAALNVAEVIAEGGLRSERQLQIAALSITFENLKWGEGRTYRLWLPGEKGLNVLERLHHAVVTPSWNAAIQPPAPTSTGVAR